MSDLRPRVFYPYGGFDVELEPVSDEVFIDWIHRMVEVSSRRDVPVTDDVEEDDGDPQWYEDEDGEMVYGIVPNWRGQA